MVSYRHKAQFRYLCGPIDSMLHPPELKKPLGNFPYRFDLVGSSKQPVIVGVFQYDQVTSPIVAETFDVRRNIATLQFRSLLRDFKGLEDLMPPELIHIGYDPERTETGMIEHILGDVLGRVTYSSLDSLPDFSHKDVDNAEDQELLDEWVWINRDIEGRGDPESPQRWKEILPRIEVQVAAWKPYGLTFLEYARWVLFKELVQSRGDPQKD